jgi:hypothetical protein
VLTESGGEKKFELRRSAVEHVELMLVHVSERSRRIQSQFFRQQVERVAMQQLHELFY